MVEKDYTDINAVTPIKMFNIVLAKKGQEYLKKHVPFDEQCARLEFRDKWDELERESTRKHGFVKADECKLSVDDLDLDQYADASRFEMVEDQENVQDKVIEGSRTQVIIGHTISYKCKKRGHPISVFIPIAEYNAMKSKNEKQKGTSMQ